MPDMGANGKEGGGEWVQVLLLLLVLVFLLELYRTRHKWRPGYKFGALPFVKNFIAYVEAQLKCDVGDSQPCDVTV